MPAELKFFYQMPVQTDPKSVLIRIGAFQSKDEALLQKAKDTLLPLRPNGVSGLFSVAIRKNTVQIATVPPIESQNLTHYLSGCKEVLVLLSTLGSQVGEQIQNLIQNGNTDRAVWLDAAASVSVDAGLDFMTRQWKATLARQKKIPCQKRFSPGYGDLPLSFQKVLYNLIHPKELGVRLTDHFLLVPEKSVIAICGIQNETI